MRKTCPDAPGGGAKAAPARIDYAVRLTLFAIAACAVAGSASTVRAECRIDVIRQADEASRNLAGRPEALIAAYPSGGKRLRDFVTYFVARDRRNLKTIEGAMPMATSDQRVAIGEGLALAANRCGATDADLTRRIVDLGYGFADSRAVGAFRQSWLPEEGAKAGFSKATADVRRSASSTPQLNTRPLPPIGAVPPLQDPFAPLE